MKKKLLRIHLVLIGFLTFFVSQSFATNFYVDPSSTSATANGTLLNPWKTISQVNAGTTALNPGDTVFFKRGQTYSGRLTVGRSGTAANPIVYTNYGTGTLPEFNNSVSGIINLSGRQYVIIDGIKIVDNSISETDHTVQAKISYAINIDNSPNCTIRNCDISRVGVGISVTTGSDYTTITGNYMHNMRMVRNTPTTVNSNDDYGANPMVIGSSNNIISNNRFEECWALSYDYGYDGGAVELFGSTMNNNKIMYNTAINCNGFMEIGSSTNGSALNNIIAYNKIINCGIIGVYQNASTFMVTVNNLQYYNNTVIETVKQYSKPSAMFWMAGTGSAGMVTLKNNIFWLSSGVNFVGSKFSSGQIIHTNNIYRMSTGTLGYTLNSNELFSTTANHFQGTIGDPSAWNYNLLSTSPAINFGTSVGITKDFVGSSITGNPDAGMLEAATTPVVVSPLVATASAGTISCNGSTTSVVVSATGGTTPYTGTGTFKVAAGTYKYIVSDAAGSSDTVVGILKQPPPLVSILSTDDLIGSNESIKITISTEGGTPPYRYSINGSSFQVSNIFLVPKADSFYVLIRDAMGCRQVKVLNMQTSQKLSLNATVGEITCNGGSTKVYLSAKGGKPPYTGTGVFEIVAGQHTFVVTDSEDITDTISFNIIQPPPLQLNYQVGKISTNGGSTSIIINASGGMPKYIYSIDGVNYQVSNVFSAVYAGFYRISIKDSSGCIARDSIEIIEPEKLVGVAYQGSISCFGDSTKIIIKAMGGKLPYSGTGEFTVAAGLHDFRITDANGDIVDLQISINEPDPVVLSYDIEKDIFYPQLKTLTINARGGTLPYLYSIEGDNYQQSNYFHKLSPGKYDVFVVDSNGCITSKDITINDKEDIFSSTIEQEIYIKPNPANDFFTLVLSSKWKNSLVLVEVFDSQGKLLYAAIESSNYIFRFGDNFIPGTYYVKVKVGDFIKVMQVIKT